MKQVKKGFTLIELMVVIAIIGILAVALVPQLTGAQARSRDAARIAGIGSVSAVLETYYSDIGAYPLAPYNTDIASTPNGCLSTSDGTVNDILADMMKGGKAPLDPQSQNTSQPCGTMGSFGYAALTRSGVPRAGYILTTNVETWQRGNLNYDTVTLSNDGTTTYDIASGWIAPLTAETTDATDSMYATVN